MTFSRGRQRWNPWKGLEKQTQHNGAMSARAGLHSVNSARCRSGSCFTLKTGRSSPRIVQEAVVLPLPDGPTMEKVEPSANRERNLLKTVQGAVLRSVGFGQLFNTKDCGRKERSGEVGKQMSSGN